MIVGMAETEIAGMGETEIAGTVETGIVGTGAATETTETVAEGKN